MMKDYPLPEGRKWVKVDMEKPRPSLNPNLPGMIITAIVAQRSDGIGFRVEGALLNDKIKLLMPKDAARVALDLVGSLLVNLETYRNCECAEGQPCEQHQVPRA